MKKRCLSWLLSMVMVISLFPVSAATAFAADVTGATDLSLNDAETVLNSNGIYKVTGDHAGKTIKITDNASVTLLVENATLSAETSPIQVENGATLTLVVADNSTNTITCTATTADETNKGMTAGISVPDGATLTVDTPDGGKGNGELTINGGYGGAGIGGGSATLTAVRQASGGKGDAGEKAPDANANSAATTGGDGGDGGDGGEGGRNGADATSAGSVTVKAGVITANGGEGAAGIGGGYGKDGENGGAGHPGVKGSDGGVRQAYYQSGSASGDGGYGGSGAGGNGGDGGTGGNGGQVVISGGTVTAVGNNAAGIGGGKGGNGGTGGNGGESQSDTVNSVTTSQNISDVWSYGGGSGTGGSGENGHGGYAGNGGDAGTLQITGGRVTAKGSVGFGGGSAGSNGNDGNTPSVARARHHGYIVFNNHGLGYRRTDTNENTLVVSGSDHNISACASAGGLPGNGGTAAARDAKTAINGAEGTVKITGSDNNVDFVDGNGSPAVQGRPVDKNNSDLYRVKLTVKNIDETEAVEGVSVSARVDHDNGGYNYQTVTDSNGVAILWLPQNEYTLTKNNITKPGEGYLGKKVTFTVGANDDTEETVRFGFNVLFDAGIGSFTESNAKTKYTIWNDEEIRTQIADAGSVPAVTPADDSHDFAGWRLTVSGTADNAVDTNKVYSEEEVIALIYKDDYKAMTFTAQYSVDQVQINPDTGGKKYGSAKKALAVANAGDTVQVIADNPIQAADKAPLKKNVTFATKDAALTYKATAEDTKISVSDQSEVTLDSGAVDVAGAAADKSIKIGNYTVESTDGFHADAADKNSNIQTDKGGKASVTATGKGQVITVTAGGQIYTYTATKANETFYLGEYGVSLDGSDREAVAMAADIPEEKNTTITLENDRLPYHKVVNYTVTLTPKGNYSIADDKIGVTMGGKSLTKDTEFEVTDGADRAKKVRLKVPVTGDLVYQIGDVVVKDGEGNETKRDPAVARDMTSITITDPKGQAVTGYEVSYEDDNGVTQTAKVDKEGKALVPKKNKATLKFPALNGKNPGNHETNAENESFDILTKLTTAADPDVDIKTNFRWDDKSYEYVIDPAAEDSYEFKATYTASHVLHVNVTAGTVTGGLNTYVAAPDNTDNVKTVIVPDGTKDLKVTVQKNASEADKNYAKAALNGKKIKKFNGTSYTIKSIDEPTTLDVAYSKQPEVSVTLKGGSLDEDASDELWTQETSDPAAKVWKTSVEAKDNLKIVFRADAEKTGIQSVTINGNRADLSRFSKGEDGSYSYTAQNVETATSIVITFAAEHTVTFTDADGTALENGTAAVVEELAISKAVFRSMEGKLAGKEGQSFFGWKAEDGTFYTTATKVTGDVTLQAVYKENVAGGSAKDPDTGLSAVIAANGFTIHVDNVAALDAQNAAKRAGAEAVGSDGEVITQIADTTRNADSKITVSGLDKLKAAAKAGTYELTFTAEDASATITVTVVDMHPTVTGKTATTLTFTGEPGTEYTVTDKDGNPVLDENGQEIKVTTGADGKGMVQGLKKGGDYTINSAESGKVKASTSRVDAEDIANSFRESEKDTAQSSGIGKDEKASNSKADVIVGEDGNYKVILKDTINGTVTVPDNWGNVNVDLNGNDIKGPDATDKSPAGAGLVIKKDETGTAGGKNPGTILGITDSTGKGEIKGGDGSAKYPDGASGIETGTGKDKPENAGITIGTGATVSGGNGATGSDGNGGTGGNGISGSVDTKVDGGSVSGGNGGAGADTDKGNGGNGGQGGAGIKTDNKPVEVDKGTVSGGAGGNGGSSTDPSGGNGGNAGNGGTGIDSGKGDITIDKDGNTTGGSGGAGGNASSAGGNGGNGGQGGNAANGSLDKDHAQGSVTGGAGGNGGNADKGTAGAGGAGGSTGIAGDAAKGESGTAGAGKKDDGNGNGKGDGEKDNGTGTVKKTTKTVTTVKKAVRTGDVAPIWLLVALLAVSAGAVITVSIRRRKR